MERACVVEDATAPPDFVQTIGCRADFNALSSAPLDASIPGATSVKVVLDRVQDNALYFQNSTKYKIHYEFASAHLSGNGRPIVPGLSDFNQSEYYAPDRRFILGAVTYYAGPEKWTLEIAPYDTASAEMIATLHGAIRDAAFFGPGLEFHPTSETVASEATLLPDSVSVVTTDDLYEGIDYQPLNLGTTIGRLRFVEAATLTTNYLNFRDVVVLDQVPNDISVVSGLITQDFQTPLSHVNVLSQNRGTPNMGLRDAMSDQALRALDGKWVRLTVGAFEYSIEEVSSEEADAYWEANKPPAVQVPRLDTTVTELRRIEDLVTESEDVPLRDAIKAAIPAFGGKAAHYSVLKETEGVPVPDAFAIPIYYYVQFMEQNGFDTRVDELLADPTFLDDPAVRDMRLAELRADMMVAPVDSGFQDALRQKLETEFPDTRMRFRSSTNAEDLDGFTGAGLYTSAAAHPDDWEDLLNALREVWSSVWYYRAFEERSYRSIDHKAVGMAILVHHSFPNEEANGVALTANPFDPSGLEPGFYVNVQVREESVVEPAPGITTDQFIYHYGISGQPIVYLSSSNLVQEGQHVLTNAQVHELGQALDAIHRRFSPAYGPQAGNMGWYAMDIEFKFDDDRSADGSPVLAVKQARPHPGRGQ